MHGAARSESTVQMSTHSNPSLRKCGNCADKPRCSNIITGLAQHFYHRGGGFLQTNRTVPSLVFLYIYTFMSVCSTHILSQQCHTSDRRSPHVHSCTVPVNSSCRNVSNSCPNSALLIENALQGGMTVNTEKKTSILFFLWCLFRKSCLFRVFAYYIIHIWWFLCKRLTAMPLRRWISCTKGKTKFSTVAYLRLDLVKEGGRGGAPCTGR